MYTMCKNFKNQKKMNKVFSPRKLKNYESIIILMILYSYACFLLRFYVVEQGMFRDFSYFFQLHAFMCVKLRFFLKSSCTDSAAKHTEV